MFSSLTAAVGAADKVIELMAREPALPPAGAAAPPALRGDIEFREVRGRLGGGGGRSGAQDPAPLWRAQAAIPWGVAGQGHHQPGVEGRRPSPALNPHPP